MNSKMKKILVPIIAVLAGFVLGAIIMVVFGYNPLWGYEDLFISALGSARSIGETLQTTGPLILTALSFAVAMKAGLFNIGMSGQALAGWITSMWFALSFPDIPRVLMIPLVVIIGMVFGALMGFIPGILRALLGTSEVITTIMLNYIILFFSTYMIHDMFQKNILMENTTDQTKLISANASFRTGWMSSLTDNSTLNIGLIIALIALVIMAIVFSKTTLGFEIKAVGLNPDASEYAGISAKRTIIMSMLVAGALAGLGGVVYGFGYMQNFVSQSASLDIGFNGMAVALLGGNSPVGILFAGLLFSILQTGAPGMMNDAIPPQIVQVVTASIIFFIAVKFIIEVMLPKAKEIKAAENAKKKGEKA
ncbi:ABC transporter permease [Lactococcus allomyrinae]|uniref:ABC transporter permease n=1 Tax=Lactococcus allomyrinae TaxID=2419773 RepID=A0A387BH47_9LACT|nr:ABC transporter permease [Lactococcus allomyrinae]AYG00190.1 ABC transporter permease [Lactococcus allomyrinae]